MKGILVSAVKNSVIEFSFLTLKTEFVRQGIEITELNPDSNNLLEQFERILENQNIDFLFTHNLRALKDEKVVNYLHQKKITMLSILDIPYNQVDEIRLCDDKVIYLLVDLAHSSFITKTLDIKSAKIYQWKPYIDYVSGLETVIKMEDRPIDILFLGRLNEEKIDFSHKSGLERKFVNFFVRKWRKKNSVYQIHEQVIRTFKPINFFKKRKINFKSTEFGDYCWKISHKIRNLRRLKVVDELKSIDKKYKKVVVTDVINNLNVSEFESIYSFQPWDKVVELIKQSKIVINVVPYHFTSVHERVIISMAYGAVVVSDSNLGMEKRFQNGESVIYYNFDDGNFKTTVSELLKNQVKLSEISYQARKDVLLNDMAENRVKEILRILNSGL